MKDNKPRKIQVVRAKLRAIGKTLVRIKKDEKLVYQVGNEQYDDLDAIIHAYELNK